MTITLCRPAPKLVAEHPTVTNRRIRRKADIDRQNRAENQPACENSRSGSFKLFPKGSWRPSHISESEGQRCARAKSIEVLPVAIVRGREITKPPLLKQIRWSKQQKSCL
jgi:hypothetical protein